MANIEITKESYKLLCLLYKEYLEKYQTLSRNDAMHFEIVPESVKKEIEYHHIYDLLEELEGHGLISIMIDASFDLQTIAIVKMENRFKKGIPEITKFILNFVVDAAGVLL